MHSRAFGEMQMLIFGQDPLVPMKLEQTFAQARPADEIKFDSFEDYDQAYDFAKSNSNVGLVFLLENCGEKDLSSVLKQFSHSSGNEDTCFGVLIFNGQESFKGLRAMRDNENFLAYYDINDLLDIDKAPFLLNEIWEKYQAAFEKKVIPAALGQTYKGMALIHVSEEELIFRQRLCALLTGEMNVSWREGFILKWHPTLEVLATHELNLLSSNQYLLKAYYEVAGQNNSQDITTIANAEIGIAQKVAQATSLLAKASQEGRLGTFLEETTASTTPRSKALLRVLKKHKDRIAEFSQSHQVNQTSRLLKVV